MAKVALFVDDSSYKNVDISNPENGNPGVGGTEYCFAILVFALTRYTKHEIFLYHIGNNRFPGCKINRNVRNIHEAIEIARRDSADCFIYRFTDDEKIYNNLIKYNLKGIAWAHNYIPYDAAHKAAACSMLKSVVMVSRQQYDKYIDDDICVKSCYIYNIVEKSEVNSSTADEHMGVTYTGAIVKGKGFHVLAKNWKKILRQVPNAQLYVIGTGALYRTDSVMGDYGIAEKTYERSFIKYLQDESGDILPSVHFMGKLGQEKAEIYRKSRVGIINPTARTETFGLGAVELQSYGVPVVLKNKNGFLDVVDKGKTGFTFHSQYGMRRRIVSLLKDKDLAKRMGDAGIEFTSEKFQSRIIANKWEWLIDKCISDQPVDYITPDSEFLNNAKWLRMFIRFIRIKLHIKAIPSLIWWETCIRKIIHK